MASNESREETEHFGRSTRREVVRAGEEDGREWLNEAPVCPLLRNHHIAHVGRMWARLPFEVIRAEASGTFALVGLEGEGEILIDGAWRNLRGGEVCLLPAFAHTGIRATSKAVWHFAWVRYLESREKVPILTANSPVVHQGNGLPLSYAIAGLREEAARAVPETAALHHWVELVHGFVLRSASAYRDDDRLWRVWEAVEADPGRRWTLDALSSIAHLSQEHLRRLSKLQLGRSPMQQVSHLRMRRAAELLSATDEKVEVIAGEIGYESPFTFSNAFKRWTGKRPSEYRRGR